MSPPSPAPDPLPACSVMLPPLKLAPKAFPASKIKSAPVIFPDGSSGASIFIEVEPLVNIMLLEIKVSAVIFPLALMLLDAVKLPVKSILPVNVISPVLDSDKFKFESIRSAY